MRRFLLLLAMLGVALAAGLAPASGGLIEAFTEQVSPEAETNATEPSVAVDRSGGTVWVAWEGRGAGERAPRRPLGRGRAHVRADADREPVRQRRGRRRRARRRADAVRCRH